jgi:D-alanyl-D-alanine carboxypeptidase
MPSRFLTQCIVVANTLLALPACAGTQAGNALERAMDRLVEHPEGPPGAIVVVQRGSQLHVYRAGVSNVVTSEPMHPSEHMRIASTSKAYSGGTALSLVDAGLLSLDDTIAKLLPWAPDAWGEVTLSQALHHTSGLPDFSADQAFQDYVVAHLEDPVGPRRLLRFVADEDLEFDAGTQYRYSNSDNIVVALMVQAVTGRPYERVLQDEVDDPLDLNNTSLPRGVEMPSPYIRGYDFDDAGEPEDVSELIAAGYAWASGGIVSTALDQNRFIRGYVGGQLFGPSTQARQFDFFPGGKSEPPGPGLNAAGLAIFRYVTRCGTMYGHTGNISGYTQFFAASLDGSRSAVVSINAQASPELRPEVFEHLRQVFLLGVCAAMATSASDRT